MRQMMKAFAVLLLTSVLAGVAQAQVAREISKKSNSANRKDRDAFEDFLNWSGSSDQVLVPYNQYAC